MTLPGRQPQGTPAGGQFTATAHAEPGTTLQAPDNRFAAIESVRELDQAASEAMRPLLVPESTDQDLAAAEQIRNDWVARRHDIFTAAWRRDADAYAERLEIQAHDLLRRAAQANLRNIADRLREEHPDAATMTLGRGYDDGNLVLCVESVRDQDGNEIDAADAAQELVNDYSSRQLNRFVDDGPIDLAAAAAWTQWSESSRIPLDSIRTSNTQGTP